MICVTIDWLEVETARLWGVKWCQLLDSEDELPSLIGRNVCLVCSHKWRDQLSVALTGILVECLAPDV